MRHNTEFALLRTAQESIRFLQVLYTCLAFSLNAYQVGLSSRSTTTVTLLAIIKQAIYMQRLEKSTEEKKL